MKLKEYLREINKVFSSNIQKIPIHEFDTTFKEIISNPLASSIPTEILEFCKTNQTTYKTKGFKFESPMVKRQIKVFWYDDPDSTKNTLFILRCILLLEHIEKYKNIPFPIFGNTGSECSKELSIFLLLTPFKKVLPRTKCIPIEPIHCNTGYSYTCGPNGNSSSGYGENTICIFREEEWEKVLIHELIHAFGGDVSSDHLFLGSDVNNKLRQMFHGLHENNGHLNVFEACTELWAELIFIATGHETTIEQLNQILLYETSWSIFQAIKLMHHFDLSYTELLHGSSKKRSYIDLNTSSFAYYIIRSILFCNLEEFILICKKKRITFIHFLEEHYQEKKLVDLFMILYKQLDKWKGDRSKLDTLCMMWKNGGDKV